MIEIYNNFLDENEYNILENELSKENGNYTWGHGSSSKKYEHPWFSLKLSNNYFFSNYLLEKIEKETNSSFICNQVYMNISIYGCQPSFHVDDYDKDAVTFVLFVHDCYQENADELAGYFFYKENKEIKCIEPLKNRGILFSSNMLHRGSNFSRHIGFPRRSIAWKLVKKKDDLHI
jgi:hypothetical protein